MTRAAHPMIQPSDWTVTPERARLAWPAERAALYDLIWNAALANGVRAPLLELRRNFYPLAEIGGRAAWLAIDQWVHARERKGYWPFRADMPDEADRPPPQFQASLVNPIDTHAPLACKAEAWQAVAIGPLTVYALIRKLEDEQTTSASSIASVLEGLLTGAAPLLELISPDSGRAYDLSVASPEDLRIALQVGYLQVTVVGQVLQAQWAALGVPPAPSAEQWTENALAGWRALGFDQAEAERFETFVTQEIEGTPTVVADRQAQFSPLGLPPSVDPDIQIPLGHPLRALRAEMEADLAGHIPDWAERSASDRAEARRQYLASRATIDGLGPFDGPLADINLVLRWLIGRPA